MNAKQRRQEKRKYKFVISNRYHPSEEDKLKWLNENTQGEFKYLDWKRLGFTHEADAAFFKLKWT